MLFRSDFMPNSLLHDCLSIQVLASIFDTSLHCVPLLGWFNDEHCNIILMNKSFTYICKLSCVTCCWHMINHLRKHYQLYCCVTVIVNNGRGIKTYDKYIYHAYTLSLLLACLQNKHRRGRLFFQEREDDEDIITSDLKPYLGEKDETTSRTTSIQEGEDDEDITTIDTTDTPTATHHLVPQLQGPLANARAHQDRKSVV